MTALPPRGSWPAWSLTGLSIPLPALRSAVAAALEGAWATHSSAGRGVRVCVLDSGIDATHPLVASVERSWDVVLSHGSWRVVGCEAGDELGHGTACAGIIRQVAPAVSLSSIRVIGTGAGEAAALAAGLSFAIGQGFDIVNVSVSTARPEWRGRLAELCDRAYLRRVVLVAAAHNLRIKSFPWTFASVISVAAHGEPDPLRYYYNPKPPVDFFARGIDVPVAGAHGNDASDDVVVTRSGNSYAAPHIAGIAARMLAAHPGLLPFQLKTALCHGARNLADPVHS